MSDDDTNWDELNEKLTGYYDRAGNEINFETWAKEHSHEETRRVGWDVIDGVTVSTIFFGQSFAITLGPPLLFETMLFDNLGTYADGNVERYATEAEAVAGHEWIVAVLKSRSIEEQP